MSRVRWSVCYRGIVPPDSDYSTYCLTPDSGITASDSLNNIPTALQELFSYCGKLITAKTSRPQVLSLGFKEGENVDHRSV